MLYDFQEQLKKGQTGESLIAAYFSEQFEVIPATDAQQRQGIDFTFVDRRTGKSLTVQVKTDEKAEITGNAFLETISVDKSGGCQQKQGWIFTSVATWLLYYLPQTSKLYIFELDALRAKMPSFAKQYPTKTARNHNYNTHGICVPLKDLSELATKILTINYSQSGECQ